MNFAKHWMSPAEHFIIIFFAAQIERSTNVSRKIWCKRYSGSSMTAASVLAQRRFVWLLQPAGFVSAQGVLRRSCRNSICTVSARRLRKTSKSGSRLENRIFWSVISLRRVPIRFGSAILHISESMAIGSILCHSWPLFPQSCRLPHIPQCQHEPRHQRISESLSRSWTAKEFDFSQRPGRAVHFRRIYSPAAKCGVRQSFSASGRPHDNAVAESFFASFKKEEAYRREYTSEQSFRKSVEQYVAFYNTSRPHQTLNYQTPQAFEAACMESL